MNQLDATMIY